jgi:NAD(P)-dependent dehydrogenase (short-subunit alcohol dehydrogenase family)
MLDRSGAEASTTARNGRVGKETANGTEGGQGYVGGRVPAGSFMSVAIVTGASRGLGRALARVLAERGWSLVIDGRDGKTLARAADELAASTKVVAVAGDIADEKHRYELIESAENLGGIDLLVNNASLLGPSPQPSLASYPLETLTDVYSVNVFGPLRLIQLALPGLVRARGRVVNVTSDAAVEGYEGWGGYGSSKAALEQLSNVLAAEQPELRVYWVDPGDMNTQMQQEAFPGEDISDRPDPETSVPGLIELIVGDLPSGRYAARAIAAEVSA